MPISEEAQLGYPLNGEYIQYIHILNILLATCQSRNWVVDVETKEIPSANHIPPPHVPLLQVDVSAMGPNGSKSLSLLDKDIHVHTILR